MCVECTLLFIANPNNEKISFAGLNPDPDPPDPHVLGPLGYGSQSISQRYGSGSFYHHAKIVRKPLIPTALRLLFDFLSLKLM